MNNRFYALKIKLMDIDPPIWRYFVVPAGITLDRLHDVIQIVMDGRTAIFTSFPLESAGMPKT